MIVTDIKEYKKGRYEIFLNDESAFILYKSELKVYGVKIGAELSSETIGDITSNVLTKRAKKRALNLLMKNDMTEMKLRNKLIDGGYSKEIADEAVNYVKGYHYIDDRRYALSFITSRSQSDSKNTIKRKLVERGVPKDIIDSCIEEYYVEDELNLDTERELIRKLALKKMRDLDEISYEQKQKIIASLMRKGFSYYDVEYVMNSIS